MKWIKKTYLRCIPLCFSFSLLLGWRVSPKSWHGMRSGRKLVFGVRWQKLGWGIRTPLPLFQTLYQRQPGWELHYLWEIGIPYMYFPLRGPCILQILTSLRDFRVSHTHQLYKEQPSGITWKKELFFTIFKRGTASVFKETPPEPWVSFVAWSVYFLSFVDGSVYFSLFMSYYWWANWSETDWPWPECMKGTETN